MIYMLSGKGEGDGFLLHNKWRGGGGGVRFLLHSLTRERKGWGRNFAKKWVM